MPSSVNSVLAAAGLKPDGVVSWGTRVPAKSSGIYVISTESDATIEGREPVRAPIDLSAVRQLLSARPELTVDSRRPTADELAQRLSEFWLPDESVLYIGLATSLGKRVSQFYQTPLGARRPHAGGWFLKTLHNLEELYVYWSEATDIAAAERRAINSFVTRVSTPTLFQLRDPDHPFPFANLEWPPGTRKRHGIKGTRAPLNQGGGGGTPRPIVAQPGESRANGANITGREAALTGTSELTGRTQVLTAADIAAGRIRVPRSTKYLLPSEKSQLDVVFKGTPLRARWDPRLGPRERSGTIGVGRSVLEAKGKAGEVLHIRMEGSHCEIS